MPSTMIGGGLEGYLLRQAREQALNRIAEAREAARQLLERVSREIEAMRQTSEARNTKEVTEKRRRAIAQARLRARQMLLERQSALIQRLWDEVEATLRIPGSPEQRRAMLWRLLVDAIVQLGGGSLEVQVNAADRALLDAATWDAWCQQLEAWEQLRVTRLTLVETPAAIWGGVIVRRADARQLVDNSLDMRLAIAKRTLRDELSLRIAPPEEIAEAVKSAGEVASQPRR